VGRRRSADYLSFFERIIRLVAHHVGAEVHHRRPRVSAELPETGESFEGLLPPVVTAPVAVAVFMLDDYVAAGVMTADQAVILRQTVAARANILVAGGTSTGKATLINALLAEVAKTTDRVIVIEDTRELQWRAQNIIAMRTKDGRVRRQTRQTRSMPTDREVRAYSGVVLDTLGWAKIIPTRWCPAVCWSHRRRRG